MVDKVEKIWLDGKLVDWDDANVHILTHTLHYGLGAFEGIRSYRREDGSSAIFRLEEHMRRLLDSMKIMRVKPPFDIDTLCNATLETLKVNKLDEAYIRPLVFVGDGAMGLYAPNNPVRLAIIVWRWGAYLGEGALDKGIRAGVSSFNRHHVNSSMVKGKICGHYVNSINAKYEAKDAGLDEAIMLDTNGYVSEATGENIFIARNGRIKTPQFGSAILGGITRETIMTLANDMGYDFEESRFTRDEMWISDEVFMVGTAAEVTPVIEIDGRVIGDGTPGPITKAIQKRYFEVLRGRNREYEQWVTSYKIEE